MFKELVTSLGRLFSFLISLAVAVILGIITWLCWDFYQDAMLQSQFAKKGQLLSVNVNQADHAQRSWRDVMGNAVYLTVGYKGKEYTTRYVRDSTYISAGDHVQLLYHPGYDAFRQPGDEIRFDQSTRKSRLIDWSTVRSFSNNNRLLFLCLLLSTATFFLVTGLIVSILPVPFLQHIARFIFIAELVVAAIFFTYDAWKEYQYYQHLKTNGQEITVRVMDTDRKARFRQSEHDDFYKLYDYDATIRYQQQERVIPISEDDFETLKPADSLKAFYDKSVDDFMSVDYSLSYSVVFGPLAFWLILFVAFRPTFIRNKKS